MSRKSFNCLGFFLSFFYLVKLFVVFICRVELFVIFSRVELFVVIFCRWGLFVCYFLQGGIVGGNCLLFIFCRGECAPCSSQTLIK